MRLPELLRGRIPSSTPPGGMRMSVITTSGCSSSTAARSAPRVTTGGDDLDVVVRSSKAPQPLAQEVVVFCEHETIRPPRRTLRRGRRGRERGNIVARRRREPCARQEGHEGPKEPGMLRIAAVGLVLVVLLTACAPPRSRQHSPRWSRRKPTTTEIDQIEKTCTGRLPGKRRPDDDGLGARRYVQRGPDTYNGKAQDPCVLHAQGGPFKPKHSGSRRRRLTDPDHGKRTRHAVTRVHLCGRQDGQGRQHGRCRPERPEDQREMADHELGSVAGDADR